ncbi:MAG: hypothetical protein ACUVRE_06300 [Thermoanaerobaculaceae bacterium]
MKAEAGGSGGKLCPRGTHWFVVLMHQNLDLFETFTGAVEKLVENSVENRLTLPVA